MFLSLGKHEEADDYFQKALDIRIQIGDRKGEATDFGRQGTVFISLGYYEECFNKSLAIITEIGDREGEAADLGRKPRNNV